MREKLMKTFDEIYVLNLHGNALVGETTPDGSPDESVFDIRQGVAIVFMVELGRR
jgi:predicted helicase